MYPLVLKIGLSGQEPIQHKGGTNCKVPKSHGYTPEASRGVLVSDVLGKRIHSAIRTKLVATASHALRSTQFGGIRGKGTDMCALMAREYLASTRRARCSLCSAVLRP